MTSIPCPWCEAPLEADLHTAHDVTCDTCVVTIDLAPDLAPVLAAAA